MIWLNLPGAVVVGLFGYLFYRGIRYLVKNWNKPIDGDDEDPIPY